MNRTSWFALPLVTDLFSRHVNTHIHAMFTSYRMDGSDGKDWSCEGKITVYWRFSITSIKCGFNYLEQWILAVVRHPFYLHIQAHLYYLATCQIYLSFPVVMRTWMLTWTVYTVLSKEQSQPFPVLGDSHYANIILTLRHAQCRSSHAEHPLSNN